jgi:RHS repeat-associated protein
MKQSRRLFTSRWHVLCVLVLGLAANSLSLLAQQRRESTANQADYIKRSSFEIDPVTLALNLRVDLAEFAGRNINVPMSLNYSSKVWRVQTYACSPKQSEAKYSEYAMAGWTSSLQVPWVEDRTWAEGYVSWVTASPTCFGQPIGNPTDTEGALWTFSCGYNSGCYNGQSWTPNKYYMRRLLIHLPDGSTHEVRQGDARVLSTNYSGATGVYVAVDGSRLTYDVSTQTISMPDGSRYVLVGPAGQPTSYEFYDRNGNKMVYNSSGNVGWTDTLNRLLTSPGFSSGESGIAGDRNWTIPGIGGANKTFVFKSRQLGTVLTPDPVTLQVPALRYKGDKVDPYTTISPALFTSTSASDIITTSGSTQLFNPVVLHQIVLPNNQTYTFTYNEYGEINKIVYPSGGYRRYRYDQLSPLGIHDYSIQARANRGIVQMWESATGNSADEVTWTYSAANGLSTMTAPDGGHTERTAILAGTGASYYGFGSNGQDVVVGKVTSVSVYDSANTTTRKLLQQNTTSWTYDGILPGSYPVLKASRNPRVQEETTRTYNQNGTVATTQKTEYSYDADQNVIETRVYDGTTLVRREQVIYAIGDPNYSSTTQQAYRNRGLISLPTKRVVRNGAGTVVAATWTTYDDYSLTTYSNMSGWSDPATTARGNPTIVRAWNSSGNATFNGDYTAWDNGSWNNNTWVLTKTYYNQGGVVVKTIDANNNETNLDLTDRFGAPNGEAQSNANPTELSNTGQSTYAFPTKVTNALGHIAYTQLDFYTGKPVDTEDPNNIKSSQYYDDPLERPTKTIAAVGTSLQTQTLTRYNDTGNAIGNDPPYSVTTISDKDTYQESNSGNGLMGVARYDGLGRVWRVAKSEGGGSWALTDTEFDPQSRVKRVSNPYRSTSLTGAINPSGQWTTTIYDTLSRATQVTTPDGAAVNTAYDGNLVTVTDQAGKNRRSETDALGRLTKVWENPTGLNYLTSYSYDVLDNLTTVTQDAQTRTFTYNSLKRLTQVTNPESGTTVYNYDNNGNLILKVDALNRTTWYPYDVLNRSLGFYTDQSNTHQVVHVFDTATSGKGKLGYSFTTNYWVGCTSSTMKSLNVVTAYDHLGRAQGQHQYYRNAADTDWTAAYTTSRTYDLASNVKSQTYPSGRTVNYSYNTAGQVTNFSGNLGDGTPRTYASGMIYNPRGQMMRETFGTTTNLYHRRYYNRRGQMFDVRLGTDGNTAYDVENPVAWRGAAGTWNRGAIRLFYSSTLTDYEDYNTSNGALANNNGNLHRMDHFVPGNDSATTFSLSADEYTYDALNRILDVKESKQTESLPPTSVNLKQVYVYDRFGNRTVDNGLSNFPGVFNGSFKIDPTTNRLKAINDSLTDNVNDLLRYDAVGNQIRENYTVTVGDGGRTYDANNRLMSATINASSSVSYTYNANSSRISKTIGGVTTWYIYGLDGELVAEYPAQGATNLPEVEYGYRSGELLINAGCDLVQWRVTDHLGSTRMSVGTTGALASIKRTDYLPFGEPLGANVGPRTATQGYGADCWRQEFTGYERDAETGLDYAQARMFSGAQGRFTSPDMPLLDQDGLTPQSWNLYTYVRNNPLRYVDLLGLAHTDANGNWVGDEDGEYDKQKNLYWNEKNQLWENRVNDNASAGDIRPEWAGMSSPMYSQYLKLYGRWIQEHSREDGMVKDPTQSPLMSWLSPKWIDPSGFTYIEFLKYKAQWEEEMISGLVGGGVKKIVISSEIRKQASQTGGAILKKWIRASEGDSVGRSGGSAAAYKSAGTELIQMANRVVANPQLKEALKIEGKRLINEGKGHGHK